MNLAIHKDTQVEPSPVPVPGSPSTSQPHSLTSNSKSADKTESQQGGFLETVESNQKSVGAQRLAKHDLDGQTEIGRSHDIVSPSGIHPRLNGSLTTTDTVQANGKSAFEQMHAAKGQGQAHQNAATKSPEQDTEDLSEDSSIQATDPAPNSSWIEPPTNHAPSRVPSPPTNGVKHSNGDSVVPAPTPTASMTTRSSDPSPSPVPTMSLPSGDLRAASPSADDAMIVDGQEDAISGAASVDSTEPLARRTRSRQKRSPDSLSKEPAKRARTSSDAPGDATTSSLMTEKSTSDGSNAGEDCTQDAGMGHSASVQNTTVTSIDVAVNIKRTQTSSSTIIPPATQVLSTWKQPSPPAASITINTQLDSNLDPALAIVPDSARHSTASQTILNLAHSAKPSNQPIVSGNEMPTATPLSVSMEQTKPTTSTPTSSTSGLANNPYAGLTLKGAAGPGYNPYALYYGPGTPITPHTPTYAYPYLYHLPSPISAQGMYPTSPTFTPSPATQKSPPASSPNSAEPQRQKPKRLKAHTVTSGNHNIPIVPRDKKGKPMLPLNVGIMTVIGLGEVCMREHFHTERYIFPVGYEVTRRYLSTVDPTSEVVYHCTILDGGDGPKFQIVPSDAPDRTVIAGTATGAWSSIVKQANAIRNRQHSNSVSGPDFFGLGQNTIKHLIQELPGADRLRDYVWQNFIEGGPLGGRHAAVTPALPEDYDSTLPIGALYPAERDRLKREASSSSPRGLNYYPQHIIAQAEAQRKQHTSAQGSQQLEVAIPDQPILPAPGVPPPAPLPPSDSRAAITNGRVSAPPVLSNHQPPTSTPSTSSQVPTTPRPPPASQPHAAEVPPNPQGSPSTVPTTIASIMNAYPAPAPTSASVPTSVSTSTASSSS